MANMARLLGFKQSKLQVSATKIGVCDSLKNGAPNPPVDSLLQERES